MTRAIIYLGCSELQLPGVKWAKEAGLSIILCDENLNSPGIKYADEFCNIGGEDIESLLNFVTTKKDDYEIVSAYCGSDFGLRAVSILNQKLGLDGLEINVVELALNKSETKKVLNKNNILTPKGVLLGKNETFDKSLIPLPLIIKPLDGSGSRGVTYINNYSESDNAIDIARAISDDILIEEVLEGDHIDVSGFFAEDKFFPGGQLDRFFSPLPLRYPVWGAQPPKQVNQEKIYKLLEQSCRALGINWGPVKADIINTKDGPAILEVTPRFHGDVSTSYVCNLTYGLSPIFQWFMWLSKGNLPSGNLFNKHDHIFGWAGIFADKVGKINSIQGIDSLQNIKNYQGCIIRRKEGSIISSVRDNTAIIGFVFASGDSHSELEESLNDIKKNIYIDIESDSAGLQ